MQTATFAIAVLGVVLSAASLGWQAAVYKLSAGRVRVELRVGGADGRGMMTASAGDLPENWADQMASEGYGQIVAAVQVTNIGRMPVTVSEWSLAAFPGGMVDTPIGDSIGKALPFRLDAGETETWAVDMTHARGLAAASTVVASPAGGVFTIRGRVRLGDGRTYTTRSAFRVAAPAEYR